MNGEAYPHNARSKPAVVSKSVGGIENFQVSHAAVCRMLFNYCIQVMWNAVFYDTIAEWCSAWRRRKLWSGHSTMAGSGYQVHCTTDKLRTV